MRKTSVTLLQIAVAIGGLVPVSAGLAGIICGPQMLGGVVGPLALDSHYRYLSGLLLGIGLGFWGCIPDIENQGSRFRLLTLIVIIGGVGRVTSLWAAGVPARPMLLALVMELIVTPLLTLWQYKTARK